MTNDHSLTANPAIVIIKTNPKEKKRIRLSNPLDS